MDQARARVVDMMARIPAGRLRRVTVAGWDSDDDDRGKRVDLCS
jgi:hypothetical protein